MIPIWVASAFTLLAAGVSDQSRPHLRLYHGGRWRGSPEIRSPKKGNMEHGPGIYCSTSWSRANDYARGGNVVYCLTICSPGLWADEARIPVMDALSFISSTWGNGKIAKDLSDSVRRVASRTGDTIPAESFLAIVVNSDRGVGSKAVPTAHFLVDHGIDASRISMGNEDWVVIFNPGLVVRVDQVSSRDLGTDEAPFDFPRVTQRSR